MGRFNTTNTATPTALRRRLQLLDWMRSDPSHNGLTTAEIRDRSVYGREDRWDCELDLAVLASMGRVTRVGPDGHKRLFQRAATARWIA